MGMKDGRMGKWGMLLLMTGSFSSCMVGPDYVKPEPLAPQTWKEFRADKGKKNVDVSVEKSKDQAWWSHFHDPVLDDLLDRAVKNNLALQIVGARIAESRALWLGSKSKLFPDLSTHGGGQRGRNNFPGSPFTQAYSVTEAKLDMSWELDLFGKTRREMEAAEATVEATVELKNKELVSLFAEIAKTYITIRNLQNQIRITQENIVTQESSLRLTQKQLDAGQTNKLDVLRADSQLWSTKSQLPYFEAALARAKYQMEFLIAAQPGTLDEIFQKNAPIPVAKLTVVLGAPADILRQRPDIRYAERQLAAATASQGVAIAQQYPKISLTGLLGFQSGGSDLLFQTSHRSWGGAAGAMIPIFNFGRIQSGIDAADARQQQAFLSYQQAVLGALAEIEGAFVAYFKEAERYQALVKNVASMREAVKLAQKRYQEGFSSFLEVLDAERTLYTSESQLAQSAADVSLNLVAVYKALGGGWDFSWK